MAYSHAHETFSSNPVFANGMTLQQPPEGTIARGRIPHHYAATPEDALRAGSELQSPVDLTDADLLRRGADVYGAFCQPCHGARGRGDGPISTRGYPPPPSLATDKAINMEDGQLFHIISYGQGNMPSHAAQILSGDRWGAIGHVRQLQARAMESAAPADSSETEGS